ncbi:PKHG3 protein, partial [Podargus strigoides]|nr:PKHG3 protein [Podargus strigoides]
MEEPGGSGAEPWAEGLRNSNNNASPGGWPGARGGHPLAPFSTPGAEPSYLGRVVLEIVESERTYARDLRSIVEGYLGKIIDAEEAVLRPEQVSALFGNIEDIYELSSTLLQNLESCASDPVAVAVCFVTRSQEFAIYTQYCNNYPSSVAALSECMRSKAQARFLRECQERLRHALPLGAYLLKPVQRILKYHLLLQEIAKHFEHKSGDDYEVVLEAIDTMTCIAWYINDMKRKHEHAIRQQEIQSLLLGWKGPDLTSYGELVLEGTFRVQRVRHERAVFLFDKTLLITKRRGDHYVYKSHIPCSSLMLIESTRDSLCFSLAHYKHGKQQHSLQVGGHRVGGTLGIPLPDPTTLSVLPQAKSVEEKRVWTHHIKRLILENHHAIIPQKAKEAILEMDLFHPPRLPRCSPEHLKKSWSCQPLGDAAELRQGRRQSGESRVSPVSPPPSLPWGEATGKRRRRRKRRRLWARTARRSCPGLGTCPWNSRRSRYPPQPPKPQRGAPTATQGTPHPSWDTPGCSQGTPHHSQGTQHHSWGTPSGTPALPGGEGEPDRAAEDLQGLSSEEEEEEEEGGGSSILPPSVLDQASVIAERFGGG